MQAVQGEHLLSVSEAAQKLGVSPSTIWRWIDARRLPAIRIGVRRIRIRDSDVEAMIAPARAADDVRAQARRGEPDGRPSAEELAWRRQLHEEIVEIQRILSTIPLTATEALERADAMQLEHDERAAGIRR